MTDNTHGQVPAIQRFEVVDCIDEKHVPAVIPKPHGPWVRYADHVTALAGQAKAAQPVAATQQAGERVYAFRRKGLADFCTCDEARYEELSNKPHLFETRIFYTAPQPSPTPHGQVPVVQGDALSDAVRVPLDSLHADAAYLIGRLREGSMPYALVIEIIRERIDAAKAAIHARAAQGDALDAARLDWLDADESRCVFHLGKSWYTRPSYGLPYRKRASLREAIDAARAAQEGGKA